MKAKTVFSEFQLYVDEEAKFFEYCKDNECFFKRPLEPYLKNECFEVYRKENKGKVFFAVVQIRISGRKLVTELIDVLEQQRQYKLLGDVLAYSEKINIHFKGCVQDVYGWRVFALDAFGDLKDVTRNLLYDKKRYIENIERQEDVLKLDICSKNKVCTSLYFECGYADFAPVVEGLQDVIDVFQRKKSEALSKKWQREYDILLS